MDVADGWMAPMDGLMDEANGLIGRWMDRSMDEADGWMRPMDG